MATSTTTFARTTHDDLNRRPIVVGISGGELDHHAVDWAAKSAQRRGLALHVVHCHFPTVSPAVAYGDAIWATAPYVEADRAAARIAAASIVSKEIERVRSAYPTVDVKGEVIDDSPAHTLVDVSRDADILVLGSERAGALEALLMMSVAHHAAHHSACPVVLVPRPIDTPNPPRIIVAVDGSPSAVAAVCWAARFASASDLPLTIVHVPLHHGVTRKTNADEAAAIIGAAVDHAREHTGVTVDSMTIEGDTVDVLAEVAGPSDLLAVGDRGRGLIASMVLGSTSAALIHRARSPLAIVRGER